MCISNTESCSNWEDYATSKSHTLTSSLGTKTVYVYFRDELGNTTGTITATRAGNGTVLATSSNTGVATVSVSGTTITVTDKSAGTATITVSVAEGTNHTESVSKTISVTIVKTISFTVCSSYNFTVAEGTTWSTFITSKTWPVYDSSGNGYYLKMYTSGDYAMVGSYRWDGYGITGTLTNKSSNNAFQYTLDSYSKRSKLLLLIYLI